MGTLKDLAKGKYQIRTKVKNTADYLGMIGANVMDDVSRGPPPEALPFRIPKQQKAKSKKKKQKVIYIAQPSQRKRRKQSTRTTNPYPLI